MITCPQCNAQNLPGMAYCENCGSPLPQQGAAAGASASTGPAPAPPLDPAAAAVPQPVMPVDQQPAPRIDASPPAQGGNIVAADASSPSDSAAPSGAGPGTAPVPSAPAASSAPSAQQAPPQPVPPADQGSTALPATAPLASGTLSITFPSGQTFVMQGDEANVGRADVAQNWHPEIDVIPYGGGAPDLGVSRHHARIIRQGSQYAVVDLGSTNGTYVNGRAVPYNQPAVITNGDTLSFGALNTQVSLA